MSWHFPLWFLNLLGCQLYQLYYKPIERVKATVPHYVHPGKFKSLWDKTKKSSTSYVFMGSQCHFYQVSCLSKNRRIIVRFPKCFLRLTSCDSGGWAMVEAGTPWAVCLVLPSQLDWISLYCHFQFVFSWCWCFSATQATGKQVSTLLV